MPDAEPLDPPRRIVRRSLHDAHSWRQGARMIIEGVLSPERGINEGHLGLSVRRFSRTALREGAETFIASEVVAIELVLDQRTRS